MTGLLLVSTAAVWFAATVAMSYAVTSRMHDVIFRCMVALMLVAVLLPLPLVDEIVGKRQFERLCKDNATIQMDRRKAVGRTVYFVPQPTVEIKGTWVRIVVKPQQFVDATTGETVVTYNELMADSGRLGRVLGISDGGVPMTFRGTCVPINRPGSFETFEPLGIKYIEPPTARTEITK